MPNTETKPGKWPLRKKILMWLLGIFVVALGLWAGYTYFVEGGLEKPTYKVTETVDDAEIRRYDPFIIASVQMSAEGNTGLRSGFRVLAGYIFGGNSPGESMPMTAPVLQQNEAGESLPMTAPVLQSAESMRMAFVMPLDRSLDDLPQPDDGDISLTRVDWGDVAALSFSGFGNQDTFKETEAQLREILKSAGFEAQGPAIYAQYNSPYAFPLLRRNEVLIPITK